MPQLRFYLDEMIPLDLALILKQYGYDVLTARDAGMLGKSDAEQLEYSTSGERAILTFNIGDFVLLHREWECKGRTHKGIIVSPETKLSVLIRLSLRLLASTNDGEIDGHLRYLQEFQ